MNRLYPSRRSVSWLGAGLLALAASAALGEPSWLDPAQRELAPLLAAPPAPHVVRMPPRFSAAAWRHGTTAYRYAEATPACEKLWRVHGAGHVPRPVGEPAWSVTVWDGRDMRILDCWPAAKVVGTVDGTEAEVYGRSDELPVLLKTLPQCPPAPRLPKQDPDLARQMSHNTHQMNHLWDYDSAAPYITRGRVVGLAGTFPAASDLVNFNRVYLFQVKELIKSGYSFRSPQFKRLDFIKLIWPDDKEAVFDTIILPPLQPGEELLVCTAPQDRWRPIGKDFEVTPCGEQYVTVPVPYGAIVLENGVTRPLIPGLGDTYVGFRRPLPIALFGQQVDPLVKLLRWALKPENLETLHPVPEELRHGLLPRREYRDPYIPRQEKTPLEP